MAKRAVMPRTGRHRKKTKMPPRNKVTVSNTRSGAIVRVPSFGGLTPRFRTNLCYDATFTRQFDGVTVTDLSATFRLNSLFDFDYSNTFGNFQPAGRDRLALLYSFLTIRNTKIEIEVVHTRDGGSPLCAPSLELTWVTWQADALTTTPTAPTYPRMLPGSQTKTIAIDEVCRMRNSVNIAKLSGMGGSVFSSGTGAVVGTNPGNPIWGQLLLNQNYVTGTPEYNNYSIKMRAIFDVEFSGPKKAELDTN